MRDRAVTLGVLRVPRPLTSHLASTLSLFVAIFPFVAVSSDVAGAGDFVPFVIPADPPEGSLIQMPHGASIGPRGERVVVQNSRFYRGGKRHRVWGVNLCFGACFPSHADATRVAERLADAGVNSVRFHHMDTQAFPRGIWDPADETKLSTESLDRLDYFLDQLARRGITANLNLHVSRTHSRILGLPDPGTKYDKIVGIFTPPLVAAQERYARELLGHVNKYRRVRYADDPAVAFVEITNENSLFMWNAAQKLPALPDYYTSILRQRYNAWLRARYGTTRKLREAWSEGTSPLGDEMLVPPATAVEASHQSAPSPHPSPSVAKAMPGEPARGERDDGRALRAPAEGDARWQVELHESCRAVAVPLAGSTTGVRIEIREIDETPWHIQFKQPGLAIEGTQFYTLAFRARADAPRQLSVGVGMAHPPWANLGLSRGVKLTTEMKRFAFGFVARASDAKARVSFVLGDDMAAVELDEVSLRPGGVRGLETGERIEDTSVRVYGKFESAPRRIDRMRFLAETEKSYFNGMRRMVREEIGSKALVTGTVVFGPLGLWAQSGMDWIDTHAYWHHPRFPGRPWDRSNWLVEQEAMVDHPEKATLFRLAASRLAGKPFTVSEYNHPAPMDYQAECVPMIASFAAAQDWDGVWLFAYSHRTDDWGRGAFTSFFDIDANPAKWGFVPAGAAMFREGQLGSLGGAWGWTEPGRDRLDSLAAMHAAHDRDMLAVGGLGEGPDWERFLRERFAIDLSGATALAPVQGRGGPELEWEVGGGRGRYTALGQGAGVWIGHAGAEPSGGNPVDLESPAFAAGTITALDGLPLEQSRKILVTACGRAENTGMQFSKERRTVGRCWGEAPVRVEAVTATVSLEALGITGGTCRALGPDGRPTATVPPTRDAEGDLTLRLSPEYRTMWYLLTRKE